MSLCYKYIVRFGLVATDEVEATNNPMRHCNELVFASELFSDYSKCVTSVTSLMSSFASVIGRKTRKQYTITHDLNPRLKQGRIEEGEEDENSEWSPDQMARLFVTDPNDTSSAKNYAIWGTINQVMDNVVDGPSTLQ